MDELFTKTLIELDRAEDNMQRVWESGAFDEVYFNKRIEDLRRHRVSRNTILKSSLSLVQKSMIYELVDQERLVLERYKKLLDL